MTQKRLIRVSSHKFVQSREWMNKITSRKAYVKNLNWRHLVSNPHSPWLNYRSRSVAKRKLIGSHKNNIKYFSIIHISSAENWSGEVENCISRIIKTESATNEEQGGLLQTRPWGASLRTMITLQSVCDMSGVAVIRYEQCIFDIEGFQGSGSINMEVID